jgi:hypothetical protein
MAGSRMREPLRGAFIAILAAAIGAGGTLAGNAIASANARDQLAAQFAHDDSVRQYDLLRDAYEKFIAAASQYQDDLLRVELHAANGQDMSETELKEITGDDAQIQALWSNVRLVGSAKAAGLAKEVRFAIDHVLDGNPSAGQMDSRLTNTVPMLQRFVDAARGELNNQ